MLNLLLIDAYVSWCFNFDYLNCIELNLLITDRQLWGLAEPLLSSPWFYGSICENTKGNGCLQEISENILNFQSFLFSSLLLVCQKQLEEFTVTEAEFHINSCKMNGKSSYFYSEEYQTNFGAPLCRHLLKVDLKCMHSAPRHSSLCFPSSSTRAAHFPLKQVVS